MGIGVNGTSGPMQSERTRKSWSLTWSFVLVSLLRITAIIWVGKGLMSWAAILGYGAGFEGMSTTYQATTIYFAVIDLVAGVGLWLTSTWGGVLWLLAVMSHLILGAFVPRAVAISTFAIVSQIGLICAYLTVSWLASREER